MVALKTRAQILAAKRGLTLFKAHICLTLNFPTLLPVNLHKPMHFKFN